MEGNRIILKREQTESYKIYIPRHGMYILRHGMYIRRRGI